MNWKSSRKPWVCSLILALVVLLLGGCGSQAPTEAQAQEPGYSGALQVSYENALEPVDQLALGTLRLEETQNAVDQAQAARLLPLWQALQGTALRADAERNAVIAQIEATMTEAQVSAIAAMRLTQDDVQTWIQSQGNRAAPGGSQTQGGGQGRQQPGGGSASSGTSDQQIEQRRQQFQTPGAVSPEVLATRRAQFAQQGGASSGRLGRSGTGGTAAGMGLRQAVIALLAQRSGQAMARNDRPAAAAPTTATSSTATPPPQRTRSAPTATPTATPMPVATQLPTRTQPVEPTSTPQPTPTAPPAATQPPAVTQSPPATKAPASGGGSLPALAQIEDTNPGPPFTIEISANVATQDPLVEKSVRYKISGLVRNDGDETYAVSGILTTFYDAEGFRGTFQPAIRDGKLVGGEWLWHGQTKAEFACLLLAPGEECPFMIEITAQDMASFLIHPDAAPTERVSAPVELSNVRLADEGTGFYRISGTATNSNAFKVKNVTVSGVLLDANGQIVSLGSTYVLQEGIDPGASVHFDVRVSKVPYARYQLYAQAEQDWN